MKASISLVLAMASILMTLVVNAQQALAQEKNAISIGHTETFQSEILNESRTLEISVPEDYSTSGETYPLAIVLDGGDLFRYPSALLDVLTPNFFPEMVVVGLPNTDRNRDLNVMDGEQTGAANFLAFIENKLAELKR